MHHKHTLQSLTKTIKQKQLKSNPNLQYHSTQELKIKLNECQKSYDELLIQSLSLIEIVEEMNNKNSQEYDVLVEELEREKLDRREDVRELQENVEISGSRLEDLKVMIEDKEIENAALRAQIEQREQRILQIQQQNRENLIKITSNLTSRLEQQLSAQIKQKQQTITRITNEFETKLLNIQQQNETFLNQNQLLSNRLEQIMKYVQQRQKEEIVEDQISPRILYNFKTQFSPQSQNQDSSLRSACSSRLTSNFQKQQSSSQQTNSPQRVVLHQILNTQDRKSLNFGGSSILSRHQNSYGYGQNNINTLNRLESSKQQQKQKQIPKMNIIQQFKAQQPVPQEINPYFIFFTLITQCAKIDSGDLEHVALMDLSAQWDHFLADRIPLHQWYPALKRKILESI